MGKVSQGDVYPASCFLRRPGDHVREMPLSAFAQRGQRPLVRPFNEFLEIRSRKAGHVDDGDPVKTPPVSGGLDARNISQLDKTIRGHSRAEAPLLRVARFEIGELPSA